MSAGELIQAAGVIVASLALMAGMDHAWKRRPARQVFPRFPGNEYAKRDYEARLEAAGEAPVRNVRDVTISEVEPAK